MTRTYKFANSDNWEFAITQTFTADPIFSTTLERFFPIPEQAISILATSEIVGIYCESESAKAGWKLGATVLQKFQTGIFVGGSPDSYINAAKIWLNQITLINFPKIAEEYAIAFRIPFWIRDLTVSVWFYTGEIADSVEDSLGRIEESLVDPQSSNPS